MGMGIGAALPETQAALSALQDMAGGVGIVFHVRETGGVRTEADTALYKAYRLADYAVAVAHNPGVKNIPIGQWRPIADYGHSYHNFGAAFDIELDATGGLSDGDALSVLGELAPECGLRWGGTFPKTQTSGPDPEHFELPITLDEARARWAASGPHSPAGFITWTALGIVLAIGLFILIVRRFA